MNVVNFSGLFILIPVLLHFGITWIENSFDEVIYNSLADISYFNMAIPFIIYSIILINKKEINSANTI